MGYTPLDGQVGSDRVSCSGNRDVIRTMCSKINKCTFRRFFITTTLLCFLVIYFIFLTKRSEINSFRPILKKSIPNARNIKSDISCYNVTDKYSIQSTEKLNTSTKSIFFLETSCKGGLNSRQACAVEAAARANPARAVVVLLAGPLDPRYHQGRTYRLLLSMEKVQLARINVTEYTKGTPLEDLYAKNVFLKSQYPVVHNADVLRLLTLNKYGGIYLDLDVIAMKSFDTLPENFIVKESDIQVASGVFGLSKQGIGRTFSDLTLDLLRNSYSPTSWNGNGPLLFKRVLQRICNTTNSKLFSNKTCQGIALLDKKSFFPIPYPEWRKYFTDWKGSVGDYPSALAHHVWNQLSGGAGVRPNSLFAILANKYCPKVYNLYLDEFGS